MVENTIFILTTSSFLADDVSSCAFLCPLDNRTLVLGFRPMYHCLSEDMVCDGFADCRIFESEDEKYCGKIVEDVVGSGDCLVGAYPGVLLRVGKVRKMSPV